VFDLERDLKISGLIAADLKSYLLGDQLYWPLREPGPITYPFPKGTLGGLLFRLYCLEFSASNLTSSQYQQLLDAQSAAAEQLGRWAVQAEAKAEREIRARLSNWSSYLEDLADEPRRYGPEYPTQAEGRTIIELLLERFAGTSGECDIHAHLERLDRQLRNLVSAGVFVWDERLVSAFPQERFWWLYASPHI
jgi:hypothetical protein